MHHLSNARQIPFHFHFFYIICKKKKKNQKKTLPSGVFNHFLKHFHGLHISPTALRKANTHSWAIRSLSIKQKSMYTYPYYYKLENMFIAELQAKRISFLKSSKVSTKYRHLKQQLVNLLQVCSFSVVRTSSKKLKEA